MLPAKIETTLKQTGNNPAEAFAESISQLFGATNTFGKHLDAAALKGYIRVLINIRATQAEIDDAVDWFLENASDFPAAHDLAQRIKDRREDIEVREACVRAATERANQRIEEVKEWALEAFGTDDPTREQVVGRLREIGVSADVFDVAPPVPLRKMPTTETPVDEAHVRRIREQAERLKGVRE